MREKIVVSFAFCYGNYKKTRKWLVRYGNKTYRRKIKQLLSSNREVDRIFLVNGGIID